MLAGHGRRSIFSEARGECCSEQLASLLDSVFTGKRVGGASSGLHAGTAESLM